MIVLRHALKFTVYAFSARTLHHAPCIRKKLGGGQLTDGKRKIETLGK
jgi:hypothetical protein